MTLEYTGAGMPCSTACDIVLQELVTGGKVANCTAWSGKYSFRVMRSGV